MELERRHLLAIAVIAIVIVAALAYLQLYHNKQDIEVEAGSGDSSAGASVRPYIDYRTEDGKVLRVYLDTDEKFWVNPDGSLTPYSPGTWTVPGTLTKIVSVKFGFTISLSGKYLKDTNSDGQQDITVTVNAKIKNNGTGQYSIFSNSQYTYQCGQPTSGGSINPTIESSFISIDTIFTNVWGGSPAQDTTYWPYYDVSISVSATSVWDEPLTASDSRTYDKSSIGSWQWKQAVLQASLGSASGSTQSIFNLASPENQVAILSLVGIVLVAIIFVGKRWSL